MNIAFESGNFSRIHIAVMIFIKMIKDVRVRRVLSAFGNIGPYTFDIFLDLVILDRPVAVGIHGLVQTAADRDRRMVSQLFEDQWFNCRR